MPHQSGHSGTCDLLENVILSIGASMLMLYLMFALIRPERF
ncbi:MAG: potassium-transporting ATPase subunit F [Chloroflexi bacterium]|nr:potassium-transporting ATPase subunit F [Chloroflexota bacterium]